MEPFANMEGMLESEGAAIGIAGGFLVVWLILMLVLMAYLIAAYVFESLGMYQIAKRRGIHNPWMAWIPVAKSWLLGSISDHYQFVVNNCKKRRRVILMSFRIAVMVMMFLYRIFYFIMFASITATIADGEVMTALGLFALLMLWALAMLAVSIVDSVFVYMVCYDLFRSCKPKNAVLFLVLTIVVGIGPFLVFACRKADEGMPPKIRAIEG